MLAMFAVYASPLECRDPVCMCSTEEQAEHMAKFFVKDGYQTGFYRSLGAVNRPTEKPVANPYVSGGKTYAGDRYFQGFEAHLHHPLMTSTGSEGRCDLCGHWDSDLHRPPYKRRFSVAVEGNTVHGEEFA